MYDMSYTRHEVGSVLIDPYDLARA